MTRQKLLWAPPTQSNPATMQLNSNGTVTTSMGQTNQGHYNGNGGDVLILSPNGNTQNFPGRIYLAHCRHVIWIGGKVDTTVNTSTDALIHIENVTGSLFMEGLWIDGSVGAQDIFRGGCQTAGQTNSWQWQNVYVNYARGGQNDVHGDVFQGAAYINNANNSALITENVSIGPLYLDNCSWYTEYQCLFVDNGNGGYAFVDMRGPVYIARSNFAFVHDGSPTSYLLWLNDSTALGPTTYFGQDVYGRPHGGQDLGHSVWLNGGNSPGSGVAHMDGNDLVMNTGYSRGQPWNAPGLSTVADARVHYGLAPTASGDFCVGNNGGNYNAGDDCGLNYVTPGYLNANPFAGGTIPNPPPPGPPPPPPSTTPRGELLAYRPPTLSNPLVIHLLSGGGAEESIPSDANGWNAQGRDVQLIFPSNNTQVYNGNIKIHNGRHLVVIGGSLVSPAASGAAAFEVENFTGTVFIEGLRIDPGGNGAGYQQDAFRGVCFTAGQTQQWTFQNVACWSVYGTGSGGHGDFFQSYGYYQDGSGNGITSNASLGAVRLDHCTIVTQYQGLFYDNGNGGYPYINNTGPFYLSNIDICFLDNSNPTSYALWANNGAQGPVTYFGPNVYINCDAGSGFAGHPSRNVGIEMWFEGGDATGTGVATLDANGNCIFNSSYARARPYNRPNSNDNVTQAIAFAHAPSIPYSHFCPGPDGGNWALGNDMCGINYVSPGYIGDTPAPSNNPTANNSSFSVQTGSVLSDTLVPYASDPNNLALTFSQVSAATTGVVSINSNGTFTYDHPLGFTGTATFQWRVTNSDSLQSNTATATITVTANPGGDVPVLQNPSFTTTANSTLTSTLAPYAQDPQGLALTFALVTQASHGTATVDPSGSFTYAPTASYVGADSFTWSADNGTESATATCSLNVTASINPPTVTPSAPNVQITVLNAQQGDTLVLNNVTHEKFFVQVINGGVGVQRSINWTATGY